MKRVICATVILLLLLVAAWGQETADWKYGDFKFEPIYGIGATYYRIGYKKNRFTGQSNDFGVNTYNRIEPIIREIYGYPAEEIRDGAGATNKQYSPFFYLGDYVKIDNEVIFRGGIRAYGSYAKEIKCQESEKCPRGGFTGVLNQKQKLSILSYPYSLIEGESRSGDPIPFYGCYDQNSLHAGDINGDNKPEIFVFSATGKGWLDDGAFSGDYSGTGEDYGAGYYLHNVKSYVSIYSGTNLSKRLAKIELASADFTLSVNQQLLKDPSKHIWKHYFSRYDQVQTWRAGMPEPDPGYAEYAKLYFLDIDKNNRMDIFVWHRKYLSNEFGNPVIGFSFASEHFDRLEEQDDGTFAPVPITTKQGDKILRDHKLTWRQGFPNKDFCGAYDKPDPDPMLIYYDPVYGLGRIVDPVLLQ